MNNGARGALGTEKAEIRLDVVVVRNKSCSGPIRRIRSEHRHITLLSAPFYDGFDDGRNSPHNGQRVTIFHFSRTARIVTGSFTRLVRPAVSKNHLSGVDLDPYLEFV